MPDELYNVIQAALDKHLRTVQYSRFNMPLSALLEESFFNFYIKSGTTDLYCSFEPGDSRMIMESVLIISRKNCHVVTRSSWRRLHILAS